MIAERPSFNQKQYFLNTIGDVFLEHLSLKANQMLSVALTPEEHQVFTNAWRSFLQYGKTSYRELSITQIWKAAQEIYAEYPELLEAARRTLFGE